jgi:hypothetical protein
MLDDINDPERHMSFEMFSDDVTTNPFCKSNEECEIHPTRTTTPNCILTCVHSKSDDVNDPDKNPFFGLFSNNTKASPPSDPCDNQSTYVMSKTKPDKRVKMSQIFRNQR